MSPIARFELALIRLYQAFRFGKPSPCRFVPSCSSYAAEALEATSLIGANRLIVARLLRCRPWGGKGADPLPDELHPVSHAR